MELKLTGGPWGTLAQVEAYLAPAITERTLASRAAALRLAILRVESMADGELAIKQEWGKRKSGVEKEIKR